MYIPLTSEELDATLVLVIFGSLGLFTSLFCIYKTLVMNQQVNQEINQQVNQQISLVSPQITNENDETQQKIQLENRIHCPVHPTPGNLGSEHALF